MNKIVDDVKIPMWVWHVISMALVVIILGHVFYYNSPKTKEQLFCTSIDPGVCEYYNHCKKITIIKGFAEPDRNMAFILLDECIEGHLFNLKSGMTDVVDMNDFIEVTIVDKSK